MLPLKKDEDQRHRKSIFEPYHAYTMFRGWCKSLSAPSSCFFKVESHAKNVLSTFFLGNPLLKGIGLIGKEKLLFIPDCGTTLPMISQSVKFSNRAKNIAFTYFPALPMILTWKWNVSLKPVSTKVLHP